MSSIFCSYPYKFMKGYTFLNHLEKKLVYTIQFHLMKLLWFLWQLFHGLMTLNRQIHNLWDYAYIRALLLNVCNVDNFILLLDNKKSWWEYFYSIFDHHFHWLQQFGSLITKFMSEINKGREWFIFRNIGLQ